MVTIFHYSVHSTIGHISIQIGTRYISWQGDGKVLEQSIFNEQIKTAEVSIYTYEQDMALYEGDKYPPVTVEIDGLYERAMLRWWDTFKVGRLFRTFRLNCCTVAAKALKEGVGDRGWGADHWPQMLWTPGCLMAYAKDVRRRRIPSSDDHGR